jgi:hypothetical protein
VLDTPELAPILEDAELAYLAVGSATGPMVTPLLFTVRDGRLWMVMPRSSAKLSAIGRDARVGVAAGSTGAMAVLQGEAHVVDPLRPTSLVRSLPEAVLSPRALGSYVAGHLDHLAGMVGPAMLEPRAAAAVRPERALAVRAGQPLWTSGGWPPGAAPYDGNGEPQRLDVPADVPSDLRAVTSEPGPVLVGWTTATGPVVLPGEWDPRRRVATVRGDLFLAAGCLPQSRACVLFDATAGTSLDAKVGLVLRGRASARGRGEIANLALRTERISWWRGDDARTVRTKAG